MNCFGAAGWSRLDVSGDNGADVSWCSRPRLFITSHMRLFFCFRNRSKHFSPEYTLRSLWPIYHFRKLCKRAGITKWWVKEKPSPWLEQAWLTTLAFHLKEVKPQVPAVGGSHYSDRGIDFFNLFIFFNELRQINHGITFLGLVTGIINVLMLVSKSEHGESESHTYFTIF